MLLNKSISILDFIRQIKRSLIYIFVYAIAVGFLDGHSLFSGIIIPLAVSGIVGTSLSLLLAFRTSQSYERWWEARTVWGAIVNDSRTLIRQTQLYLPDERDSDISSFAERQIIWCYALGETLRKLPFSKRVAEYIDTHGITETNIPNALLNQHSKQLKSIVSHGMVTEFAQLQIDNTLARLCDAMGKCERIKNTIFPRNYSLLIHFLIYVFATILPFGLDDKYLAVEIILTAALPIILIAIEKTAILMQDPFENLPLDVPVTTLSITIETNIRQAIGDKANAQVSSSDGTYYIM